jgi:predicted ABC-type ATPase
VPNLTVFAGPNGSGKSTIVARLKFEGKENLLDPDAIARRIDPADPSRAAIGAAREVISRTREYLSRRESFAVETTLASRAMLTTMSRAQEEGFFVRLVYVCLNEPERNIRRVLERVARGGHAVPEDDVRRRYGRRLRNLPAAFKSLTRRPSIVTRCSNYDNSSAIPRKVFETRRGKVAWRGSSLPPWAETACEHLHLEAS